MVESFKRYYHNSFLDRQRQEAYNLFLGNYVFSPGQPMLWDLSTDYYLHHADPRAWPIKRKSYVDWFTPENLKRKEELNVKIPRGPFSRKPAQFVDYWPEYYRPLALSSFNKIFTYKMNSTLRYIPFISTQDGQYDLSPFRVRSRNEVCPKKELPGEEVTVGDPQMEPLEGRPSRITDTTFQLERTPLPGWLQSQLHEQVPLEPSVLKDLPCEIEDMSYSTSTITEEDQDPMDQSAIIQWTLNQFVARSLNPSVADSEAQEYQ